MQFDSSAERDARDVRSARAHADAAARVVGRPPARPLVWIAGALVLGTAAGRWGAPPAAWWSVCVAALVGAWLTQHALERFGDGGWSDARSVVATRGDPRRADRAARGEVPDASAALHAASAAKEPPARTQGRFRAARRPTRALGAAGRPRVTTLVLIALVGAWRVRPPPNESDSTRPGASEATHIEGEWRPTSFGERGVFGRVVDDVGVGWRLELPHGVVAPGERIVATPVDRPMRAARGPVAAPRTPGALDTSEVWKVRADEVRRVARASTWSETWGALHELRTWSLARCDRFGPDASAFARALLFGDESRLRFEVGELFTRTGVRHVLAVSGMHVALIAAFLLAASGGAHRVGRRRASAWLTLAALVVYSGLSGAQPPVRRAVITIALAIAGAARMQRRAPADWRRIDSPNLLAAALIVELLCEPRTLFSISLQLSYVATLGLILAAGPLSRWIATLRRSAALALAEASGATRATRWLRSIASRSVGSAARLGPTRAPRAAAAWCARAFDSAFAASIAASLATAPLCWIALGELSPIGVVATPVTGPLVAWLLVYGLFAVYLPLPTWGFRAPYELIITALEIFDELPGTPQPLPPRPALWIAFIALGLWLWTLRRRPRVAALGRCVACGMTGFALLPWAAAPTALEVHALDVGHGTAIAIRTRTNAVWCVDAGSNDRFGVDRAALGPLLAQWDAAAIHVAATHPDRDHTSAFERILERWPVRVALSGAAPGWGARLPHSCVRFQALESRGVLLQPLDDLRVTVIAGGQGDANEASLALVFQCAGREVIVTGDAVEHGVDAWLASGLAEVLAAGNTSRSAVGPRSNSGRLLLWPHHGDPTERASEILDAVQPDRVWISAARSGGVEPELDRRGVRWEATYRSGPLTLATEREPEP